MLTVVLPQIPSLTALPGNALMALGEARAGSCSDYTKTDLVIKVSLFVAEQIRSCALHADSSDFDGWWGELDPPAGLPFRQRDQQYDRQCGPGRGQGREHRCAFL